MHMTSIDQATGHDAVARLYELARSGDCENVEFAQLDSLIYARLTRTYDELSPSSDLESAA